MAIDFIDVFASLLALIILEVVLGIDNLVFLVILSEKLQPSLRRKARRWGLMFAWVTRLILLFSAVWLIHLRNPLFSIAGWTFSVRDLFLLAGGGFLIFKATQEIHHEVNLEQFNQPMIANPSTQLKKVVLQIGLMDIIFSLDSILTAVGLTTHFWVMVVAITLSIMVMIYASEPISNFIHKHPTIKMLALSFLMLIGTVLIADGFAFHIPRGYVYFAMGFSLGVEALHWVKRSHRRRRRHQRE